jgi:hypothetical protein
MSTTSASGGADDWRPRLATMTVAEKHDLMEAIWEDLSQQPQQVPSPAWHGDVLQEREKAIAEGRTEFRDWDIAKREIRERFLNR